MSPNKRMRDRMTVVLHMAMTFVIMILLAQLWLFTLTLEAMERHDASIGIVVAALIVSLVACGAVWLLIRFFLMAEENH
jgi:hypothetical protein